MNLLAIDTSTRNLSLAVSRGEKVLRYRNVKLRRPLSSSIMPSIQRILGGSKKLKARLAGLESLDGFAVGLGPGSFTSLRVGLATVKGLAFATGKPVVGIPSPDILALNAPGDNIQVCTLCDAKRNLVYTCLYEKKGDLLKRKGEYLLTSIQEALKRVKGNVTFVGDGVELFKKDIQAVKGVTPTFVDQKFALPQARCLIPLALRRFNEKKVDNIDKLIPLYLYPDDCQIRR